MSGEVIRIRPVWAGLVVAYMAVVFVVTFMPGEQVARLGLSGFLISLGHVPLFAGFSLLAMQAVVGPPLRRVAAAAIFCTLFAALDEWGQRFAPGRLPSPEDFALDTAGIGLGLLTAAVLGRRWRPVLSSNKGDSQQ